MPAPAALNRRADACSRGARVRQPTADPPCRRATGRHAGQRRPPPRPPARARAQRGRRRSWRGGPPIATPRQQAVSRQWRRRRCWSCDPPLPSASVGGPGGGGQGHRSHGGWRIHSPRADSGGQVSETGASIAFPDGPRSELERTIGELVDRAQDVLKTQGRLRSLLQANKVVVEELELEQVLRRIAEAAVVLVDAQYGALGVIA